MTTNNNGQRVETLPPDYFNTPQLWLTSPMYEPPSDVNVVQVQKEINQICGVTRNNEPIIKLVWNGDQTYWQPYFEDWDWYGNPIGNPVGRPLVKMGTAPEALVEQGCPKHVFPPRWLFLQRYEPEYYAQTWKRDTQVYCNHLNTFKRLQPEEPPTVWWDVFMVVCEHKGGCCEPNYKCYGHYAHPKACFNHLEQMVEANKNIKNKPFTSATTLASEMRGYYNDYRKQCLEQSLKYKLARAEDGDRHERLLLRPDMPIRNQTRLIKDITEREIEREIKLL